MNKVPPKKKLKSLDSSTAEEISKLDKNELLERIKQLEAHNAQLKNIIIKSQVKELPEKARKKPFDFTKHNFRRVLLRILYFGWDYKGLAVQEDSTNTIEHYVFNALIKSCLIESRERSDYHRCGRTDKGVSAFGQVISISLRSKYPKEEQFDKKNIENELQYCKILNRLLPQDIRAVAWLPIPDDKPEYSARFDCKARLYKYYFPKSNLNIDAMNAACKYLVGSHDFRNLCKMDVGNGVTEFVRRVFRADVVCMDDFDGVKSMYCLEIEGNAFLWHQIRCIFGVLLLIGQGKEDPNVILQLLNVDENPRKPQYSMALDVPLNLYRCKYELEGDSEWVCDRDEMRTVIAHLQGLWTMHSVKTTMIRDCLESLESDYGKLIKNATEDIDSNTSEREVLSHTDCLLEGVKSRTYKPLLKRDTCYHNPYFVSNNNLENYVTSLEERIDFYKKKRKIEDDEEKAVKNIDESIEF